MWTVAKSTNGGVLERKDVQKRKLSSAYKETGWAAIDSNGELILVSGYEVTTKYSQINILDSKLDILRSWGIPCANWGKVSIHVEFSIIRWNFTSLPNGRYFVHGLGTTKRIYYFAGHRNNGLQELQYQDISDQILGAICNDFCPQVGEEGKRISWVICSLGRLFQENIYMEAKEDIQDDQSQISMKNYVSDPTEPSYPMF